MDLDMILLRFTSVFVFLYISFTVMTGILKPKFLGYEDINVAFGVIYTIEIVLQIAFTYNLKIRVSSNDNVLKKYCKSVSMGPLVVEKL
jgi:hypothetical protein